MLRYDFASGNTAPAALEAMAAVVAADGATAGRGATFPPPPCRRRERDLIGRFDRDQR